MSSNPFEYVNQILYGKKNLMVDDLTEKDYVPFLTNRSLSYHRDCVLFANEMNRRPHVDKKLQFSYLLNSIRSQKRPYTKWVKPEPLEDLECVKLVYGYSDTKACQALALLTDDQRQQLKELTDIGGVSK